MMSKVLSISMPDEMVDTLKKMAEEQERSVSVIVRKFIQEGLDSKKDQNQEEK